MLHHEWQYYNESVSLPAAFSSLSTGHLERAVLFWLMSLPSGAHLQRLIWGRLSTHRETCYLFCQNFPRSEVIQRYNLVLVSTTAADDLDDCLC